MAMIVQHNITSMNANRQLGISTSALAKSTEKLSSGYRINRAADDAAGLAISEKMRSQIRGLEQASTNASDGISMIQTAEGALQESHSILQRMRELAVQAANGTETDDDRGNIQDEIEQLQEELDRIASDTEFNTRKLLDGSLSSGSTNMTDSGPKYGIYDGDLGAFVTSSVAGVKVVSNVNATAGGESAIWSADGKTLTLSLTKNKTYSQVEIDKLIENAMQEDSGATNSPADVTVKFSTGVYTAGEATDGLETVASKKASSEATQNVANFTTVTGDALATADVVVQVASPTTTVSGIAFETAATGAGAVAKYDSTSQTLTITLVPGKTYTNEELQELLNADPDIAEAGLTIKTTGDITAAGDAGKTQTALSADKTLTTGSGTRTGQLNFATNSAFTSSDVAMEISSNNLLDSVTFVTTTTAGGAKAEYDQANGALKITLEADKTYTNQEIQDLIDKVDAAKADGVKLTTSGSVTTSDQDAQTSADTSVKLTTGLITGITNKYVGANQISITSNRYGIDQNFTIQLDFSANTGEEKADVVTLPEYDMTKSGNAAVVNQGVYKLSLASGTSYTSADIEKILAQAGLDVNVKLSGNEENNGTDEPNTLFVTDKNIKLNIGLIKGAGLGDEDAFQTQSNYGNSAGSGGITLQVGANEGQTLTFSIDDMSSASLGVNGSKVDCSTQTGASNSIGRIDDAIQLVSKQRSLLGAVQNRLEHTISNLDNTAENLQDAESSIRDVDMASEMVTYSKYNILQQAGQSMLAQANQSTQGVLSLLQG